MTGGTIKLIALVTMLIDHIGSIFEPFYPPIWLRWIGRISAPLFFVMIAEGIHYTRDRRKYLLRIYLIAVLMRLVEFIVPRYFVRIDGWFPPNAIFTTITVIALIAFGYEQLRCARISGVFMIALPIAAPFVLSRLPYTDWANLLRCVVPDITTCEGGVEWVIFGLLMCALRQNRKAQMIGLAAFFLLPSVIVSGMVAAERAAAGLSPVAGFVTMMMENYQWMASLAVIPLAFYNGKRGKLPKYLFYVFYPLHIYILYFISCVLY